MAGEAVHLVVGDDLRRSRLTVFFRALLVIPHALWASFWAFAVVFTGLANWLVALVRGRPSEGLHGFHAAFVRYLTHASAYLLLGANPFPGFAGDAGTYPVDLVLPPRERQSRWVTGFRALLALPPLVLATVLVYGGVLTGWYVVFSVAGVVAVLGWLAAVVLGRMPQGFRDLVLWCICYAAQVTAYVLLLTERYPDSDPDRVPAAQPVPPHPVTMRVADDLRRSRLTVFFRYLLALPHSVWLQLWTLAALLAASANWAVTLVRGTPPPALHRFLSAYVRYWTHVNAFLCLVGNPFPGFTGAAGSYPIELETGPPERQSRWVTGFRLPLVLPVVLVATALSYALALAAFGGWFFALATGRMPRGLRNVGAYVLRYSAQLYAYAFVLTDRYPYSGPFRLGAPAEPGPGSLPSGDALALVPQPELTRERAAVERDG